MPGGGEGGTAVFDEAVLEKLDFPRILEALAGATAFAPAREAARALRPSADPVLLAERQARLAEAMELRRRDASLPRMPELDPRAWLERLRLGAALGGEELFALLAFLRASARLAAWLLEEGSGAPRLGEEARRLPRLPALEERLARSVAPDGSWLDTASSALAALRRRQREVEAAVRQRLEAMVRSLAARQVLQEAVVTVRSGRFCLPVRADQRSAVPGIVHDRSESGATFFIEPAAVVELGNRLRQLEREEEEECRRLARELSALARRHLELLEAGVEACTRLELLLAEAELAERQRAVLPALREGPPYALFPGARHPLLGERAVPVDLEIGRDFDLLVVTGPNTGGKTVSLKTLGLLALMAQSGLAVPAEAGSELAPFPSVWVDVGDEQSIEQSLSTFSSHMGQIAAILEALEPGALVLLDEIGAGTDPREGAALAAAILEDLLERGARVLATTHLGDLKLLATRLPRAENASVAFDEATLQPTYRLELGLPGRSHALVIARRLGLPERVVERARALLPEGEEEVGALVRRLEEERAELEAQRRRLARLLERQQQAAREAEERLERVRQREERLRAEARAEALAVVAEAKREADRTLRELRRLLEQAAARPEALRQAEEARQALHRLRARVEEATAGGEGVPAEPVLPARAPRPGERVWVDSLRTEGELLEVQGRQAVVRVGFLRVEVPLAQLRPLPARDGARAAGAGGESRAESAGGAGVAALERRKAESVAPEVDVRGMSADEALERVAKYLDDALLAGLDRVRIIHGKGTGVLRRAVGDYLRGHPLVAEQRLAPQEEGGAGVTVVLLRPGREPAR
ncbi:MAG: endonuclease MutS2 [Clostridia bacterium]|nr:endonuclease MutS2 [Clostridia bacterium]